MNQLLHGSYVTHATSTTHYTPTVRVCTLYHQVYPISASPSGSEIGMFILLFLQNSMTGKGVSLLGYEISIWPSAWYSDIHTW